MGHPPNAMPDDVIAVAMSYDASGRYGTDAPFTNGLGGYFAGGEWKLDATHNELATVSNGGTKPADALLTLHYDNGAKKYELQQSIAPGEQMWVNLADLVHNRVADRKGNLLPAGLTSVTYDVQDLGSGLGHLMESDLAVDNTWGHHVRGQLGNCCGVQPGSFDPGVIIFDVNSVLDGILGDGYNACTNVEQNVTPLITDWYTGNSAIATASSQTAKGVSPGFTTLDGQGITVDPNCTIVNFQESPGSITVQPVVSITSPAPSAVPVATAQPGGGVVGNHEVYISATCAPEGKVNPEFNWSITEGSNQVELDSTLTGGPTMGVIGIKGGTKNGVTISVTCTDKNTNTTSTAQTATMTAQQPGSLSIVAPDNTAEKNCTVQGSAGCETDRTFTYQVNDTNGNAMAFVDIDFWDYITTGTQNSCGVNSYVVSCSGGSAIPSGEQTGSCKLGTTISGQFPEDLSVCATVCGSVRNGKCTGSCSTGSTQTWIVNGFPITRSPTYQCNSISVQ
jgi:hypothetical protein